MALFAKSKKQFNEDGLELKYQCPVCGKLAFAWRGCYEVCDTCGWEDDPVQAREPDEDECANHMSLNQARAAYKAGKPIN